MGGLDEERETGGFMFHFHEQAESFTEAGVPKSEDRTSAGLLEWLKQNGN